jgi:hypothetical protein
VDITLDRPLYLDPDKIPFNSLGRPEWIPSPPYRELRQRLP